MWQITDRSGYHRLRRSYNQQCGRHGNTNHERWHLAVSMRLTARTISNNVVLSGTVNRASTNQTGSLTFNSSGLTTASTINTSSFTDLYVNVPTTINEVITGAGFKQLGNSTLNLNASNSFGSFAAWGGTTNLGVNGALGGINILTIYNGATVQTSATGLVNPINSLVVRNIEWGTLRSAGSTQSNELF